MDKIHTIYVKNDESMQDNTPNACGPLAVDLLCSINEKLKTSPDLDIKKAIDEYAADWKKLDSKQQNAKVTGIRSELLTEMALISQD